MDPAVLYLGLSILDQMVDRIEGGGRIEVDDAAALLQWLRLDEELSEERQLIAGAEEALRRRKAADFVRVSRRLCLLFRSRLKGRSVQRTELPSVLLRLERKYAPRISGSAPIHEARGATP
jgi:hypothetical protein